MSKRETELSELLTESDINFLNNLGPKKKDHETSSLIPCLNKQRIFSSLLLHWTQ